MLVLFDLDDTLINGDCAKLWINFCVEKKILNEAALEKNEAFKEQYKNNSLDMSEFVHFFLESVKDKSLKEVNFLVAEFIKKDIKPFKEALELVKSYKDERKIIISASADFLVKKIAKIFDIDEVIAINCELIADKFSGKTKGVYSFKDGKVLRLKQYLGKDYESLITNSIFYSDSINDLPLLESVKKPVVCNGDEKLLQIARQRGYEILNFKA